MSVSILFNLYTKFMAAKINKMFNILNILYRNMFIMINIL